MGYIDDCKKQFNRLPADIKSKLESAEVIDGVTGLEKQYGVKLNFVVMLVAIGELAIADIPEYLRKKYQMNYVDSMNVKRELVEKVFQRMISKSDEIAFSPASQIKEIFRSGLVSMLRAHIDMREEINQRIIYLFFVSDELTQEELAKLLYANEELLVRKPFVLEKRAVQPTVANWLKDFIKYQGVGMFDNVILSRYITSSQNTKILDSDEKHLVTNLLKLYRNLNFFPESMPVRPEDWEMFPIEGEEVIPRVARQAPVPEERVIPREVIRPKREMPAPSAPSLVQAFQVYERMYDQILKKEDELMVRTQGVIDRIKRELANAARRGDRQTIIACLKLLARDGSLRTALQDHPAWFEATAEFMRRKYSASLSGAVVEQIISGLKFERTRSELLSEFLQYLLQERAKMNENDSALAGLDIGQILDGESQKFAYGNEAKGQFEWVKSRIENGRLVSELG